MILMIPCPAPVFFGTLKFNPGGNGGVQIGKTTVSMQDINGDGLPDHIWPTDNKIDVRINRTGKTNLLKQVKRPLGGKFTLEYKREGNTSNLPQSKWTLSKVSIDDGMSGIDSGSGSVHTYSTTYNYYDGFYARGERDFYGFGIVEEINVNDRRSIKYYHNTDYYYKGLEKESKIVDGSNNIYARTTSFYEPVTIIENQCNFPKLTEKWSYIYDGISSDVNSPQQSTSQIFEYDNYGNVTSFTDRGDTGTSDDVTATITYNYNSSKYIMSNPLIIRVTGSDGTLYRKRMGYYDNQGKLIKLIESDGGSERAQTNIIYYSNGNLKRVTGPENSSGQRYSVYYKYDVETETHIEKTWDSFGYISNARYDLKKGKPIITTDINGNSILYNYDDFGRVSRITAPYDIGGNRPTFSFIYNRAVLDANNNITTPAIARTMNKGYYSSNLTIDTMITIDGFKRVIQSKKTSEVNHVMGMTMSGRAIYDSLGRVTKQGQPGFIANLNTEYTHQSSAVNPVETTYDILDRKIKITHPDSSEIKYEYGFVNGKSLTRVIDPEDKKKETLRDVRGLITSVIEYLNGTQIETNYRYNPMKEITRVTDDKNNVTNISYDNFGRRTEINNPDTGFIQYFYDTAGNMIRKITPNLRKVQKSIKYRYDYNRLVRIDYVNMADVYYRYGTAGESYNRAGRIASVEYGDFKAESFYGKIGELIKSVKTIKHTVPEVKSVSYTTKYEFDTMGRMRRIVYPDGEILTYMYDMGGLLKKAIGKSRTSVENYIEDISYDKFGQRVSVKYGNETTTSYTYNELNRRLTNLKTVDKAGKVFQNIDYSYDKVGNIVERENDGFFTMGDTAKISTQSYQYDDMHRLISSNGSYNSESWLPYFDKRINTYTNAFVYDTIGNFTKKVQVNTGLFDGEADVTIDKTTYTYDYEYTSHRPHAVTKAGTKSFTYDDNGNMLTMADSSNSFNRTITWNEENRITRTNDNNGLTDYVYDDTGNRITKKGKFGELCYVNNTFTIRNSSLKSFHVFAGNTRVASRLVMMEEDGNGNTTPVSNGTYYTHPDHLGSSSYVTNKSGTFHESLEYFPYGEMWVHEKVSEDSYSTPYKFTSKEQDPETGLYNYGHRYYDPVLSQWVSADPAMITGEYLPSGDKKKESNLPGMGGVYNSKNLDPYHYANNNPIKYTDPDGRIACGGLCIGAGVILVQNGPKIYRASRIAIRQYGPVIVRNAKSGGQWVARNAPVLLDKIKGLFGRGSPKITEYIPTFQELIKLKVRGFQSHHILPQFLGKMLGYTKEQMLKHPATLVTQFMHTGRLNPEAIHKAISRYLPAMKNGKKMFYNKKQIYNGLKNAYRDLKRPELFKVIKDLIK